MLRQGWRCEAGKGGYIYVYMYYTIILYVEGHTQSASHMYRRIPMFRKSMKTEQHWETKESQGKDRTAEEHKHFDQLVGQFFCQIVDQVFRENEQKEEEEEEKEKDNEEEDKYEDDERGRIII